MEQGKGVEVSDNRVGAGGLQSTPGERCPGLGECALCWHAPSFSKRMNEGPLKALWRGRALCPGTRPGHLSLRARDPANPTSGPGAHCLSTGAGGDGAAAERFRQPTACSHTDLIQAELHPR